MVEQAPDAEAWRILSSLTTQMVFEYRPMLLQDGELSYQQCGSKLSCQKGKGSSKIQIEQGLSWSANLRLIRV